MNSSHPDTAVAVIGMGCRLPGARDIDQFWKLVREGGTAWGPAPESRFNRRLYYHPEKGKLNKSYSDLVALVDYSTPDRANLPISESIRAAYDIAHVTLCEVAAAACRHAGLDPFAIPYDNTGVYIGHAAASPLSSDLTFAMYVAQTARYLREASGFEQLGNGLGDQVIREIVDSVRDAQGDYENTGEGPFFGASYAARLIAETFSLSGPCMSFNAACASSSRALAHAMRALQSASVDMAIVGGASFFTSDTLVLFSQSQALSATGSCPFSAQADGMVAGEGYVALVLKTLGRALADKDSILAIIPGIGVSSDGHGKSLWAPRHEGQIKAIQRAYGPGVSMSQLQYIEAHATSTAVGDVTEMKALTAAFAGQIPAEKKIPAGSAKLNVGHTLESAGLVGVLKTILALQNEVIPPAVGDIELNPDIDWERAPIYVSSDPIAWPRSADGTPRRAGVNAFGIGGLNVHVVVDDHVPTRAPAVAVGELPGKSAPNRPRRRSDEDDIAIIGIGAVLPGALTREAFWELLMTGRDPKIEVPSSRWDASIFHSTGARSHWETPTTLGGFITGFEYDWRKHKIPPKQIQQASPLQFMILDAVDQAIHQAKYHERPFDRQQVGVVVGTIFGGEYSSQLCMGLRLPDFQEMLAEHLHVHGIDEATAERLGKSYGEVLLKKMPALLDETGSWTASALASRITKSFDLMGGAVAVDAGQASSMAALSCCVEQLRAGDCQMMICVGGQNDMTPISYADLAATKRLAAGPARSPFDVRARGILPGEGCGALLLKRLGDARRDQDPILGIVRGIGAGFDRSAAEASRQAVVRALGDAQLSPDDVSMIEVSPYGNRESDVAELQGIVDGYSGRQSAPLQMGTVVGQIGDIGGGAGMASLLKAALEVETVEMPPDAALEQAAPYITRHSGVLTVPKERTEIAVSNFEGRLIAGVHSGGNREVSYHVYLERGTKLKPIKRTTGQTGQPASAPAAAGGNPAAQIIQFDATARRREKKRVQASGAKSTERHPEGENGSAKPAPMPAPSRAAAAPRPAAPAPAPQKARPTAPQPVAAAPQSPPQPLATSKPQSAAKSNGATHSATPTSSRVDTRELEKFLVNFVVEQTGYPAEIVELDADLEADLGIDSIKKAQLFGELGEYFEVQASDDLSLDDFPTLRHVLNYLVKSQGGATTAPATAAAAPPPVAAAKAPNPPRTAAKSNGAPATSASPAPAAAASRLDAQELEKFLVNFVVEQTGYPAEIVELDADLEADLGIDSIKKAQLFGELGEYFEVQASDDLSLDDFPTLRHVLNYLMNSQGAASETPAAEAAAGKSSAPAPPATQSTAKSNGAPAAATTTASSSSSRLDPEELEKFLVNFVVEQTGYPAEIVELDADLEADLGIDSIKKAQLFGELGEYFEVQASDDLSLDDFPTLRHVLNYLLKSQTGTTDAPPHASPTAETTAVASAKSNGASTAAHAAESAGSSRLDPEELEKFLVNFVVEQTGYPAEIVELDADLEADLGIDSIKKAQLFGELGEYFEVQASDDLSLDDFPTLRHVLEYLLKSQTGNAAASR